MLSAVTKADPHTTIKATQLTAPKAALPNDVVPIEPAESTISCKAAIAATAATTTRVQYVVGRRVRTSNSRSTMGRKVICGNHYSVFGGCMTFHRRERFDSMGLLYLLQVLDQVSDLR